MKKAELIVIPMPWMGHVIPAVGIAKRMVEHDQRISITILVMNLPFSADDDKIKSLQADASINGRITFLLLPRLERPMEDISRAPVHQLITEYKPLVKRVVQEQVMSSTSSASTCSDSPGHLAGFMVDMICTTMIDVANELNVPSYVFFTSGAGTLSITFHFQTLTDDHGMQVSDEFKDLDTDHELDVPGFMNRVPASVLPSIFLDKDGCASFLNHARRFRETKGIMLNTFMELEPHGIQSLLNDAGVPPIYPVGPIVNLNPQTEDPNDGVCGARDSIMRWLDDQPPSSVMFLCFGSIGSFTEEQVREVAKGLELSGHRFLWSLRRPSPSDEKVGPPQDYDDLEGVLPGGFLDRTAKIGKIIGWAPQVAVLSHPAIGGFVSHCGWNSTLESLWFGVPIAAWPMYAEQQLNAFHMIREMGLAIEIRMDYRWDIRKKASNAIVEADAIEKGVRKIMDLESDVRSKVKEMSEICRKTMVKGGSSYDWLGRFIENVFVNIPSYLEQHSLLQ
ncbi:hypothetical protein Ancab_002877 [Ancistrocladus abbreviatus]